MACVLAAPAAAQEPGATLPSLCGEQKVKPSRIVIACADAGLIAKDLVWRDWGEERAHATGVLSVNLCDPSCVEGTREEYPVALTASRLRDCFYGRPQYTRVTYGFPAASPPDPLGPTAFPCPTGLRANPKITTMTMWTTGHGAPGPRYFVRVHVRARVCAVRGRSEVDFHETQRVGQQISGEHIRTLGFVRAPTASVIRFVGSCVTSSSAWAPTGWRRPCTTRTVSPPRPSRAR